MPQKLASDRRKIRLAHNAYLAGETFLLTVCTHKRTLLFDQRTYARATVAACHAASEATGSRVWCSVVMPDHAHLLVAARVGASPLDTAACFKRLATVAIRSLGYRDQVWQRRIHDVGIRQRFSGNLGAAVRYVLGNPVRKGLASRWDDWPFRTLDTSVIF